MQGSVSHPVSPELHPPEQFQGLAGVPAARCPTLDPSADQEPRPFQAASLGVALTWDIGFRLGFMYPEGLRARPHARLSANAPVSTILHGRCHQQAHLRGDDAEARREVSHLVGGVRGPTPTVAVPTAGPQGSQPLGQMLASQSPSPASAQLPRWPSGRLGSAPPADQRLTGSAGPTLSSLGSPPTLQAHRPYGPPTTSTPAFRQKARTLGLGEGALALLSAHPAFSQHLPPSPPEI